MNKNQERKILECIAYLAEKTQLTDIKTYKLLWLADRLHLGMYARTITGDEYYAMERGPVPSYVKNLINRKRVDSKDFDSMFKVDNKVITLIAAPGEYNYLSDSDKMVLDMVLAAYGNEEDKELSRISHDSPEWKRFEPLLKSGKKKSCKMIVDDFFEDFQDPKQLFVRNGEPLIAKSVYYCE